MTRLSEKRDVQDALVNYLIILGRRAAQGGAQTLFRSMLHQLMTGQIRVGALLEKNNS